MKEAREIPAKRIGAHGASETNDSVLVEEPLEIYVNDRLYTLTMRLVGEEIPLAVGLCFTDGLIGSADDLRMIRYCNEETGNRIDLYLGDKSKDGVSIIRRGTTHATYSSCGICGSELVTNITLSMPKIEKRTRFGYAQICECQKALEEMQTVHKATGCAHGAGIFDSHGVFLSFAEDVGRHNALDKAIGKVLLSKSADRASIIILSSRISYEMALKAGRLGVEILAAPSAVTSLAIELASAINLTLIGFLRNRGGNVYSAPDRIAP
ncbi:MAG: formate dehydrogenase accessory protein [Syntrophorhabdus sp. PtaU1.Bin058]|nr:MAG: formate dehydrogenase accessory protein [Syntrophorhabdus sp. PtaU1.Bin058]